MRERGARLLALVHDHVHIRRVRVRAHALAPDGHRGLDLVGRELGERVHGVGRVHDHLVRAERGPRAEQVGLAAPGGERIPPAARSPAESAG